MANEVTSLLNELTVSKLKAVAEDHDIDVSSCRHKRDYVQRIASKKLTEHQIRESLDRPARASKDAEVSTIKKEIETIADSRSALSELPEQQRVEISRHIDETMGMRPTFFNMDAMTEAANNRMIVGDYVEAIRINREERIGCLESFSAFQIYSAAVSIKAAELLFSKLQSEGGKVDPAVSTALAEAKKAFIDGPPRRREGAIETLEALAAKSYSAFTKNTEKEEEDLKGLLADYESFGVRTEEARRYVDIASQAKQSRNLSEYARLLKDARRSAEAAKGARAGEIGSTYHIVRSAVAEAKEVGVNTESAESDLEKAKESLDDGKFAEAISLMASVERAVDFAHLEQIRSKAELEVSQRNKVAVSMSRAEPVLMEAASYGLDVKEGLGSVGAARVALGRKDTVNAAKYARRAAEIADGIEKPLDQKRIERGVMTRVDEVKCGKCGEKSIYALPNDARKCIECGHSFSLRGEPGTAHPSGVVPQAGVQQPEKEKKKGLFRW
ncbi:MAG TPA: hypothetical protein VGB78_00305 [Thermoplasmata archaeon]